MNFPWKSFSNSNFARTKSNLNPLIKSIVNCVVKKDAFIQVNSGLKNHLLLHLQPNLKRTHSTKSLTGLASSVKERWTHDGLFKTEIYRNLIGPPEKPSLLDLFVWFRVINFSLISLTSRTVNRGSLKWDWLPIRSNVKTEISLRPIRFRAAL